MDIHFSEANVSILLDRVLIISFPFITILFLFSPWRCPFNNLITLFVLLQFMVLLILRHSLPLVLNGTDNISFPVFMV